MNVLAMVCGGDPRWGVPTVLDQPQQMLTELTGEESERALPEHVTHVLLLTRPTWEPQMQRLATLLRAYDRQRHVSVLTTGHTPLGMAVVAREINSTPHEPGQSARRAAALLDATSSGWWVRRPGRVDEARPSLKQLLVSWFSKTGYLVSGPAPSTVVKAEVPAWARVFEHASAFVTAGEMAELQRAHIQPYLNGGQVWGRDISAGGRQLVGRQRAFEWAATRWDADSEPEELVPMAELSRCSSCGASVTRFCAFCHARWGLEAAVRAPLHQPPPEPAPGQPAEHPDDLTFAPTHEEHA